MSADLLNSFPVPEVPSMFPGRPAIQTVWRWIREGVPGPNGERIKLDSFKVAGRRFVTRDAIDEFVRASNPVPAPIGANSPNARETLGKVTTPAAGEVSNG